MKPIHKFNSGLGATLCHKCRVIINVGFSEELYCKNCINIKEMAQQTAVEWLLSELQIRLLKIKSEPDGIVRETMIYNFLIDTEQANQMYKEQIGQAYMEGLIDGMNQQPKEYYNETYGKTEQE